MTTYTSNLGLALPVTGDLTGTWGQTVNDAITSLLDSAVAGTTTLNTDADVTLTDTTGAANQSRQAIIRWTAGGTVTRNITAPARTKVYVVINATSGSQSIVFRGAGPTTGVTLVAGERALVAWSGTDFVKVTTSTNIFDDALFINGYTEESVVANTGATYTISFTNGTFQVLTLTANCTFTFPTPAIGKSFILHLRQDGTGSRLATWPATVKWPASVAPTLTTTANRLDRFVFSADSTNWYGSVAGQNYTV